MEAHLIKGIFHRNRVGDNKEGINQGHQAAVYLSSLICLASSATYHYRIKSVIPDTEFNAISGDYTFTTLTPPVTPN